MMAQGCRIRLEAGIFLKYSEIEILPEGPLKDSLIQALEQAWSRLADQENSFLPKRVPR